LGVGGEDLGYGLFKLATRLHQALNFCDPFVGDVLDALLTPGHESERPNRVPLLVLGAMASRLATAAVSERKRAGEQVGRNGETAEEFELALAKSCGLRALGCNFHMNVILHAEDKRQALFSGMRK
jgi:hypothetical protein